VVPCCAADDDDDSNDDDESVVTDPRRTPPPPPLIVFPPTFDARTRDAPPLLPPVASIAGLIDAGVGADTDDDEVSAAPMEPAVTDPRRIL
jgi:hypothetical protein